MYKAKKLYIIGIQINIGIYFILEYFHLGSGQRDSA